MTRLLSIALLAATLSAIGCNKPAVSLADISCNPATIKKMEGASRDVKDLSNGQDAWVYWVTEYHSKLYVERFETAYRVARHDATNHIKRVNGGVLVDCKQLNYVANWDEYEDFNLDSNSYIPVIGKFNQ